MLSNANFRTAFKATVPILFGYVSIGIPFGLMSVSTGYPWWLAPLMSLVVFSGTAQYLAIALFASGILAGTSFWTTLTTFLGIEFFVGLRHIFYSLSFIKKYEGTGKWKLPLIYTLSDETYALISDIQVPEDANKGEFYAAISLLDYSYWFIGTLVGSVAGQFIPAGYLDGVDFALTALFIVLMINQIRTSKDWVPSVVGVITACVAVALSYINVNGKPILPSQHIILVGLSLGIAAIIFVKGVFGKKTETTNTDKNSSREEK
ncbi:MAG: AzlC family ABC transporter permease [Treponema sp.]|nr:AzlC family ABC transporter permease [Candidatus Treponema equifaecale]